MEHKAEFRPSEVYELVPGGQTVIIPVTTRPGDEYVPIIETSVHGFRFSGIWNPGDVYNRQNSLTMVFGDIGSTMYDISLRGTGPINNISNGKLSFQCWSQK